MKAKFALICMAGAALAQDMTTSVWDGVYTQAQADRGRGAYAKSCAACHGDQLTGGEIAPPLAGGEFMSNWNGVALGQLFDRVTKDMPPGTPSKVTRDAKVDILAFMLSVNKFPASDSRELPSQTAMMNAIRIDADKPKK